MFSACLREPLVKISLRPGQRAMASPSARIGPERAMVDVVGEVEEGVRVDALVDHQRPQGRAVALIVVLLQPRADSPSRPRI